MDMVIYVHRYWRGHYGVLFVCKRWWRCFRWFNWLFGRVSLPLEMVILDKDDADRGLAKGDFGEILW